MKAEGKKKIVLLGVLGLILLAVLFIWQLRATNVKDTDTVPGGSVNTVTTTITETTLNERKENTGALTDEPDNPDGKENAVMNGTTGFTDVKSSGESNALKDLKNKNPNGDSKVVNGNEDRSKDNSTTNTGAPIKDKALVTPAPTVKKAPEESSMTAEEFEGMKNSVAVYGEMAKKNAEMKISPILLTMSGLEPEVEAMRESQVQLQKQVDEFYTLIENITPSSIIDEDKKKMLSLNAQIESQYKLLQKNIDDLKAAKKAKDIESVANYLRMLAENFDSTGIMIQKLNAELG